MESEKTLEKPAITAVDGETIPAIGLEDPQVQEILDKLSPNDKKLIISRCYSHSFSGPIPHPTILSGYENVQPGLAERVVRMAEKEQEHRFDCEKSMINGTLSSAKRGQTIAFIIACVGLVSATIVGILGSPVVASILGGSTVVGLVTVFITNRAPKSEEVTEHHDKGE